VGVGNNVTKIVKIYKIIAGGRKKNGKGEQSRRQRTNRKCPSVPVTFAHNPDPILTFQLQNPAHHPVWQTVARRAVPMIA